MYICFIERLFVLKYLRFKKKKFKKIWYIGCFFLYLSMKIGEGLKIAVQSRVYMNVASNGCLSIWSRVSHSVKEQVRTQLGEVVDIRLYEQLYDSLCDQLWN